MYSYFYGKIISINKKSITIDVNNIGYVINTPLPEVFLKDEKTHLYVFSQLVQTSKNSYIEEIYGFKTYSEKELFLLLMKCQGIGPKTALSICSNDLNVLKELIIKKDIDSLSKCKFINSKTAKNIIDNLYEYYQNKMGNENGSFKISEVFSALKALGYNDNEINYAIANIEKNNNSRDDVSTLIANAIKEIVNKPIDTNELNK